MNKTRLEAFSDGVLAIILTIMVLELKVPHGDDLHALTHMVPVFLGYVLSFVYVGIYWNNHHHLLHVTRRIDGGAMWANLHLLFWLSLVPVGTAWVGENPRASWPAALYGVPLFMAGFAWLVLQRALVACNRSDAALAALIGKNGKGKISTALCAAGIGLAFVDPAISDALYALVAALWLVPDRRLERAASSEA
jgi:uncharacterized membrane protein